MKHTAINHFEIGRKILTGYDVDGSIFNDHIDAIEIQNTDLNDFISTLKASAQGVAKSRINPVFRFGTMNDGSAEPTASALGIGCERYVNDGAYKFTFPLINGSSCYAEHLRKFKGNRYTI